jgi:hypothetical protein
MSVFEITMLLCFGFAWPFSIVKSYKARSNNGKSNIFLFIVVTGYCAGILHKVFYNYDSVIWFYVMDMLMVLTDMTIYVRNARITNRARVRAR